MKKVILLVLFMPYLAYGQIMENFESGNLDNWFQSYEKRWKADTLGALSGNFSLHHDYDNPDAGNDKIGVLVKNLHLSEGITKWTFQLRHGYDPSSSNNWAIFLMSDSDPENLSLTGGTNGYAITVNMSGYDDTLRLVKVKGTSLTTIVNCRINWQTDIGIADAAKIIVERSIDGKWDVSVSKLSGNFYKNAVGVDGELFSPVWFSVWYRYSSTRDRLLWVDDIKIEGIFYEDTKAPLITDCKATGKKSVLIIFSEQPVDESLTPENFSLNSAENRAVLIEKSGSLIYNVDFTNELINKSLNNLIVRKLCDKSGNCISNLNFSFTPVWAESGDVIISEIMADPLPVVSLPGKEYIEVTNKTDFSFNLKNWSFKSADQNYVFPEVLIEPGEILITCLSSDVSAFLQFGKVVGLKQFPGLTDAGKIVCLNDSTGTLIHGVEYTSAWYGDELKSYGGWSLEMIDLSYPFYAQGNWRASSNRVGGTPGVINSVVRPNPDISFPGLQNVFAVDSNYLEISFSEPVLNLTCNLSSIRIDEAAIKYLHPIDPLFRKFSVKPSVSVSSGKIHSMEISSDITDFAGNIIEKKEFRFGITENASRSDVLFNELFFNPYPGDADYIELYNNSDKIVDVSRLQIVSINDETGDTSQLFAVSDEAMCFLPGTYYAITNSKRSVLERYYSSSEESVHEVSYFPTMNDDNGHLILFNRELEIVDEVFYNEKMHYSLLSGFEGIALEKIAPGLKSEEALNWHSATESSGWGTPGAPNSLIIEHHPTSQKIMLSSSKITPDNDGFEDFLLVNFNLSGPGNIISVTVFDETGNFIRKIASNMLAAPEATLIWDGTADDGSPVRTGIYIIYITLYNDSGETEKWKKVCTVLR